MTNASTTSTIEQKRAKRQQNKDFQVLGVAYITEPTDENFNKLYKALKMPLKTFIYGYVKNTEDTEIVLSEVFAKLVTKRESCDMKKGRFSTWIYTIARNASLSYMYHRDKWNFVNTDISEVYDSAFGSGSMDDHSMNKRSNISYMDLKNGVEMFTTKEEVANKLSNMIETYIENFDDKTMATVVKTKLTEKITFQQLADKLNITLGDARKYFYDGKKMLADLIMGNSESKLLKDLYFEAAR